MYKHLLLPTDGSPVSRAAVRKGVALARALGARVTAFYAAPPATPLEYRGLLPVGYVDPAQHAAAIRKAAARHLGAIERAARAAGVPCTSAHQTSDYPAEAIVAAAKRHRCDLIFMGSHGHRGFRASLLGTQTQKVLAASPIPVLVTR
ncbi:MAG TPA: universal stress protein [Burkholderiales bacterium]|nr:universal stress protein [Burkholderiales bacterium]